MSSRKPTPAPQFTRLRDWISQYILLPTPEDLDLITMWTMGTWTFSPACGAAPFSYPYLYLTGAKGSGKTLLGNDILSNVCRNHKAASMLTGPTLFRMIGTYDEESGVIISHFPTLFIDEIDAVFSGAADEALRGTCNVGYKRGMTIPRAQGKGTIDFPVYCPKIFGGIDNGHLPDTITDRCIRIDIQRATPDQMKNLQELYDYEVEDEAAELQQMLSDWAKSEAMVLRDYKPEKIEGLSPRQWEISRSLVQLSRAAGVEDRIRHALHSIQTRRPERPDGKVALYRSILTAFDNSGEDRLTTRQLLAQLLEDGVRVPGDSGKGLSVVLKADGINPRMLRLREGERPHEGIVDGQPVQRGYLRYLFDDAFNEFLSEDES